MLHLHGLQPHQRLPGRHCVAEAGTESDHRPGHRRQQGSLLDYRVGLREPGQDGERDVAVNRVDVHMIAVSGYPIRRGDTGIDQYYLVRCGRE